MESLFLFITASLAVIIIPGPDFIYVLSRGISGGRTQGIVSAAGISAGLLFHSIAAAFGIAVLLQNIPGALQIIKFAGGFYLVYLGTKSIFVKNKISISQEKRICNKRKCFVQGFICNILNPKIILFFLAFLPQFVEYGNERTPFSLLLRGLIYAGITFVLYSVLGLFSGIIGTALSGSEKTAGIVQTLSAVILITLGFMMFLIR